MQEETKTLLRSAIFDALETVFFLCPEPFTDEGEAPASPEVCVAIRIGGGSPQRLTLSFTHALLMKMGEDILDRDREALEEKDLHDLAKEACNIVAGAYVQGMGSPPGSRLSIPEIVDRYACAGPACQEQIYSVEDERLRACLCREP